MTIDTDKVDKSTVILSLSGRLDTANAPQLERKIKQWGGEITDLILDFSELAYISSMGLRVLLQARKTLIADNRRLIIKNMQDPIREIFEMTGFINLMVLEEKFVIVRKDEPDAIVLCFNGEMKTGNISSVTKELAEIKKQKNHIPTTVTVFLDMEKLADISVGALKQLDNAISETAWKERKLYIRNVPENLKLFFEGGDLKEYLKK